MLNGTRVGNEAGGHGGSEAPPLLVLLAAVLRDFQPREGKPLIVAAGGIATGAQIAGLLAMGADGVVLGTRFLFTHECGYTSAKKQAIMKADLNSTLRTTAFDEAARLTSWPPKCDGRAIANGLIDDYKAGLSLEERIERYTAGVRDGDQSRDIVWAGVGVGLTSEIEGAAVSSTRVISYNSPRPDVLQPECFPRIARRDCRALATCHLTAGLIYIRYSLSHRQVYNLLLFDSPNHPPRPCDRGAEIIHHVL
jgi:hypothetical protein